MFDFFDNAANRDEDTSWQDQANCLGVDPDLFFPERGASTREAKEVCRGCVVRAECLEFALQNGEKFGIWGGLSERERRRIRRQRAQAARSVLGAYVQQTRDDTRPWGLAGGGPGGKAGMWLNPDRPDGRRLNSKVIGQVLKKGDVLRLVGAGGGGWGDPRTRDAALAERDRTEGFG